MDDRADDRLRGGMLAVAALLAVTAGGGWWWAEAPDTGPPGVTVGVGPALRGVVPPRSPQALADVATSPDAAVLFRVDGETGRVIEGTELPDEDGEAELPRFTDTVWREQWGLTPGEEPVQRESLADGRGYVLQYRCTGRGELLVAVIHGSNMNTSQTTCDGELGQLELPQPMEPGAAPPEQALPNRAEFSAVGPQPVRVQAQLVALP